MDHDQEVIIDQNNKDGKILQARLERNAEIADIRKQIHIAQEYINVGFWSKGLEILKKIIDDPKLPREDQAKVEDLYKEAREMMDEASLLHPDEVEKFGHFNLPTDDVN